MASQVKRLSILERLRISCLLNPAYSKGLRIPSRCAATRPGLKSSGSSALLPSNTQWVPYWLAIFFTFEKSSVLHKKHREGGLSEKPGTSISSELMMICFPPICRAKSRASSSSRSGKVSDFAVTANALSPNKSTHTFNRKVLSTPPEKATVALPA